MPKKKIKAVKAIKAWALIGGKSRVGDRDDLAIYYTKREAWYHQEDGEEIRRVEIRVID